MIDFVQSNLVAVVAGAAIASIVLGAAGWEAGARGAMETRAALDALALDIGSSACSAAHPITAINLTRALARLPSGVASVTLLPDHVRAKTGGGAAFASVAFAPLLLSSPVELLGWARLTLAFDPVDERCQPRVS